MPIPGADTDLGCSHQIPNKKYPQKISIPGERERERERGGAGMNTV